MSTPLRMHAIVEEFEVQEQCLCVGGRKISDIAAEFPDRPLYLYDSKLIRKRIRHLRDSLPDRIQLHYAMKANPMPAVVELIGGLVDGLDIASEGELQTAIACGADASAISFAGPGKRVEELHAAVDAGITINVESETELGRLVEIARTTGKRPQVAIRVNPDFELKSSGMKMSGGPKQFGIDAENVPRILNSFPVDAIDFAGFHIFSGSQNLRPESICESQQKAVALALELAKGVPQAPKTINIGGGFGIPYFPGDKPLELESISANLDQVLRLLDQDLPETELVLELGRYFVAEAGIYVCQIVDRKESRGEVFLVTNGGLHHHLAASGNFGQVIRKNYPVLIANRIGSDQTEAASVVGPLCTPLDLLAHKMELAVADIGDYVAVFQSGAYGYTASPQRFLSHPEPKEILL